MGLDTYIAAYRGEYLFMPAQTIAQEICGVECTWACPYFYVIYDPASGRFLDLWDLYRVEFDGSIRVEGEKILCPYRDMEEQKTVVLTIPEIRKLLAEKGTGDM